MRKQLTLLLPWNVLKDDYFTQTSGKGDINLVESGEVHNDAQIATAKMSYNGTPLNKAHDKETHLTVHTALG